jgi:hypothetical protein
MTIYLAGIVRNLGERFLNFEALAMEFLKALPDAHVYVYENNSTDNTKKMLQLWQRMDEQRIHVRMEDISEKELLANGYATSMNNTPCRMEVIAAARNKLMEMLEADGMGTRKEDIVVMIDPDIPTVFSIDILIHYCRNFPQDMDAIFANGKSQRNNYYDASAFYDQYNPFGMELMTEKFVFNRKYKSVIINIPPQFPPLPVYSAFGGIGIYRGHCIRGLRYSGVITEDLHKHFLNIKKLGHPWAAELPQKPTTHIDGALQGIYLFDKELFYRNNSGYNYPVICEHVPFHASMIARGHSRLFVMPSLIYISDHWE